MKRIIATVAVVLIVVAFAVGLTACNADDFEQRLTRAGYSVVSSDYTEIYEGEDNPSGIVWYMNFSHDETEDYVGVMKFKTLGDAKDYENVLKNDLEGSEDLYAVKRSNRIVVYGTKNGVNAAF